ncbi:hypothetical protein CLU92_0992 [Janthinobacterium sp. 61]|nr:hypothetical protein CLU92_0992 [Janthinobacterium sp. 61]
MDTTVFRVAMGAAGSTTVPGQQAFTVPGTYSLTVARDTYLLSVVLIGGASAATVPFSTTEFGLGGNGGSLRWIKDLPVTPGEVLTVVVGKGGAPGISGESSFLKRGTLNLLVAAGGNRTDSTPFGPGPYGGVVGGGNGGPGGILGSHQNGPRGGGGGGAGGYSGDGGKGASAPSTYATNGSGGGGGGGGWGGQGAGASGGGGVGLLGEGVSGVGNDVSGGTGGSGGAAGSSATYSGAYNTSGVGGTYGGASGGAGSPVTMNYASVGPSSGGAGRVIWGPGRSYPSTRTADE